MFTKRDENCDVPDDELIVLVELIPSPNVEAVERFNTTLPTLTLFAKVVPDKAPHDCPVVFNCNVAISASAAKRSVANPDINPS